MCVYVCVTSEGCVCVSVCVPVPVSPHVSVSVCLCVPGQAEPGSVRGGEVQEATGRAAHSLQQRRRHRPGHRDIMLLGGFLGVFGL